MKTGSVPSSWMNITHTWDVKKLLQLLEEVNNRGIDHKDLEAVKQVWEEIQH